MRALPGWPKERYLELSRKYWRATRGNLLPADLDSPLCAFTVPPAALNPRGSKHSRRAAPIVFKMGLVRRLRAYDSARTR